MSEYHEYLIDYLKFNRVDEKTIADFTELCGRYDNNDDWDDFLCAIACAIAFELRMLRTHYNRP